MSMKNDLYLINTKNVTDAAKMNWNNLGQPR